MGATSGEKVGPGGIVLSQCATCRHLSRLASGMTAAVCAAFPNHIPDDVLSNRTDHRKVYPGGQEDNAVLYEPAPGADPANVAAVVAALDALG